MTMGSDMDATRTLRDLFAYNGWADELVFALCRDVDRARLEETAAGTVGTIEETLKHLAGVEDAYLDMLHDRPVGGGGSREEYFAHDLAWFATRSAEVRGGYSELLASADASFLAQPLNVPWFDFPLTKHSAQHRAQVLSVLGDRGVKVPDVDYILYLIKSRGTPA
jgi:uncharacterized damage-inducible protein DinB